MKNFIKFLIHKIKNLDNLVSSYKEKTGNSTVPSKAYLNWGIHLAIEGKINDAIEKFEMSTNMAFTNPENYTNWGIALAKLHRFDEAVSKFDEALKIDKTDSCAYSLKGAALIELNRTDEALDCYHMAVKYSPYDPEIYINWGVTLARLGQKQKAESKFRRALQLSMTHVHASFLLAVVLYEQNKLQEAFAAFNYTLKLDNNHLMAHYYLSLVCTKLNNYDLALDCAITTTKLAPFRPDFMVNLAECYYDVNNIKYAIKTYHAIEAFAPDDYAFLVSAGIFWQKVKKFKKSVKYLEKAIQKSQADYLTRYYYALTLGSMDRTIEAKDILLDILNQKPDFYDGMLKLAIVYKNNEEYDNAIELLTKLFEKSKQYSKFYNLLAECYKLKGDISNALENYKKMLEYYPDDLKAQIELAQIYYIHQKDLKNATRMVRNAYKTDKDNAKINTLYALILAEDNCFDSAIEKIDRAIELEPNNIEFYLRKAYILKLAQYNDKYQAWVENLKNKFPDDTDYINSTISSY